MNEQIRILPELRAEVEYIPIRHNPTRRVSLPGMYENGLRMEKDTPGPLMSFVLGMGDFFRAGALFAALFLMLMIAAG